MKLTDDLKKKIDNFFDNKTEEELKYIAEKYQSLQLQQTGVSGCKCKRHCKQCGKKVSCDEDFCDNDCSYLYYR